jgi:hypothetical protein
MHRPILALLMMAASAPAFAADWRLVNTDDKDERVTFVDLDGIRPVGDAIRTASTYEVTREADEEGIAAQTVDLRIDCADRRMRVLHLILFDEANRQVEEVSIDRPWVGPFDEDSQGQGIVDFVCSDGASQPNAESWGSERPFHRARRELRASSNPK